MTVSLAELQSNYTSNTAPSGPVIGQLWNDSSTSPAVLKKYTGTGWDPVDANVIADNERDFEARAEAIRKITPSGFSFMGNGSSTWGALSEVNSLMLGIDTSAQPIKNGLILGYAQGAGVNFSVRAGYTPKVVVNGYSIKIDRGSDGVFDAINTISLPAAPSTGTRQDLVFLESWKEEVNKTTGVFFPFGNTQYANGTAINGATLTQTPGAITGAAYFTASAGIYCVPVSLATAEFIRNPDNNIGVLENGNYFQIRYRIRVEADVAQAPLTTDAYESKFVSTNLVDTLAPQGQLASAPARGPQAKATGTFLGQQVINGATSTLNDRGIVLGCRYIDASTTSTVSGLSLDGYTYALPICAVHRRNTGVWSLANHNGTAFENAWVVSKTGDDLYNHGVDGMGLVTVSGSTFKVARTNGTSNRHVLVRVSGAGTPTGAATFTRAGVARTATLTVISVDLGEQVQNSYANEVIFARPTTLAGHSSDVIERCDVTDLRHLVSLSGRSGIDKDALFQQTQDLLMSGQYRQESGQLDAYDNDGNGTGLITTGIYGNVLLESLGLGATVPDASTNTNLTRKLFNSNGTPTGFNGARAVFSDAETVEDFTAVVPDQAAEVIYASDEGDGASGVADFSIVGAAKEISVNLENWFGNDGVTDAAKKASLLAGHTPDIKWGNGAKVAGVLTRNSDYNWSFEIAQYGVVLMRNSVTNYIGDIYEDPAGNQWKVVAIANGTLNGLLGITGGTWPVMEPVYADHNGSVLPSIGNTMTKISGLGPVSYTLDTTAPAYITTSNDAGLYKQVALGYSLAAHGTGANESIIATFKINYKAGSSCLPYLPFGGEEVIKGATVFLNGVKIPMSSDVRCTGYQDASTKTVTLTGFAERRPVIDIGDLGTGVNNVIVNSPSVLYTGGQYVMFYSSSGMANNKIYRATSADGLNFTGHQLVLDVGANTEFDDTHVYNPVVILDGATWKMWYSGHNGATISAGYATSANGIAWTKQGEVVVNTFFGGTLTAPSAIVKSGATYYLYCTSYSAGRYTPWLATSADGITWTSQGTMYPYSNNDADWNYYHVNFVSVIKDGSVWKALVVGKNGETGQEPACPMGRQKYMVSSDGKNWTVAGSWASETHEGGFDATYIGSAGGSHASLIKVDGRYEVFYTANGAGWRIGKMYLAMSQPGATGSSTTGAYTNANPQVNLGFRSTDTVILNYERKATQTVGSAAVGDVEAKLVFSSNTGTNLGNSFLLGDVKFGVSDNADVRDYLAYAVDVSSGLDSFRLKSLQGFTDVFVIEADEYFPQVLFLGITPAPYSDVQGGGTRFDLSGSLLARYPIMLEARQLSGQKIGSLSVLSQNDGRIRLILNLDNMTNTARVLAHHIGTYANIIDLIGRPLVK